jgi:superfamily II DNA or RNA helicase
MSFFFECIPLVYLYTMITLRPYQIEAIEKLRENFSLKHKRQILCLTTGAGKTVVFSEMVRRAALKGTTTLILTDRIELFKQTFISIEAHGITIQEISAKSTKWFDYNAIVTVAMVETFKRRLPENYSPKLIIIDEAHKGNFTKILDLFPDASVIGATATPVGKHIPKYYTEIVQTIDTPELISEGYLANCRAYQMQDDFSDLEVKAGEYTEQSLFNHFNKRNLYSGVVEQWQKLAYGKKTVVFNVNIEHSENMTKEFLANGIKSECITSKTPKEERERILAAFKSGLFPVLNNCGILTTGWDEPTVECVVMNRKTKSLPLWLQCCGRGSRKAPNKDEFIVLDFGMNHDEHGLWEEQRKWKLEQKKKKNKIQEAAVKTCPDCEAMLAASANDCKFCGYIYPEKKTELKNGVMVEVKTGTPSDLVGRKISSLDIDELIILEKSKKFKATYIWRVVRSKGAEALTEYASKRQHKRGWLFHQQKEMLTKSNFTDYTLW